MEMREIILYCTLLPKFFGNQKKSFPNSNSFIRNGVIAKGYEVFVVSEASTEISSSLLFAFSP